MANLLLWGHSLRDYQDMFDLNDADLDKKLVDCGAGPASFNADMHALGKEVMSCDDLYSLPPEQLEHSVNEQFNSMLREVKLHQDKFNWDTITGPQQLSEIRQAAIKRFFADFTLGKQAGRYRDYAITDLKFADFAFDIALSLHHLFSLHAELGVDYHVNAIKEMARIAKQVRIFPLLDGNGEITPLLGPVMLILQQENYGIEVREVPFQLHKKGNAMLQVWAQECELS